MTNGGLTQKLITKQNHRNQNQEQCCQSERMLYVRASRMILLDLELKVQDPEYHRIILITPHPTQKRGEENRTVQNRIEQYNTAQYRIEQYSSVVYCSVV